MNSVFIINFPYSIACESSRFFGSCFTREICHFSAWTESKKQILSQSTSFILSLKQKFKKIKKWKKHKNSLSLQPGKKKSQSQNNKKQEQEIEKEEDGGVIGANLKGMVVMCIVMMLMMFAVHCTWVTSNAYSSPSVVLASTNYDG